MRRSINEFGIVSEVEELNEMVVSAGPLTVKHHLQLTTIDDLIGVKRLHVPQLDFLSIRRVDSSFTLNFIFAKF